MNNTLTGLGLALVLALLAALIGPWFVNWSAYRDAFAAQASALVGAPVKVSGAVDARLLPSPYVRFRALSAGSGASRLSVDEVEVTLAIAPLVRGEVKAERVKLVRPRLGVEILADGTARTAFSGGKTTARREGVSLERIEVVDGAIDLTTPAGRGLIERVAGVGEAGTLSGPYRFEGSGGFSGRRYELRVSTARADASGAIRLKLALEQEGRPETLEADGALTLASKPRFDGRATIQRPVLRGGAEPWRLTGAVKADPGRLAVDALDLVYGPDERAIRLGGRGALSFGDKRRFDLALETRQLDLDRFIGENRPKTPQGILASLADDFGLSARSGDEGRLSLDVRGIVLAGDVIQDLKAVLASEGRGWRIEQARAALPGSSRVVLAGAVGFAGGAPGYSGDVEFETSDLAGFRRWLAGGGEETSAPVRSLALKGAVTAGATSVAIDEATLQTNGARSTGRIAWRAGEDGARPLVEAALTSEALDLDALGGEAFVRRALGAGAVDALVALDAKSLTLFGVTMADVSIDGALGADALDLKRFSVRDAGGARIEGAGRIVKGADGPEGRLGFDVSSERLRPLLTLIRAAGAPAQAVDALERRAGAIAPVKLRLDVEADGAGERLAIRGDAAGGKLEARVSARALSLDEPAEIDFRIDSADGRRLAALVGFDVSPVVEAKGGVLSLRLTGAPAKGMTGEGQFSALGVDFKAKGVAALAPVVGLSAEGEASLSSADLSTLAEAAGRLTPGASPRLPSALSAKLAFGPEGVRADDISGTLAGRSIRGRMELPADARQPIEGALEFDELSASALAGLVTSPSAAASAETGRAWPSTPFGPSLVRGLSGRLQIAAKRMPLGGGQVATDARFKLAIRPSGLAVEGFSGRLDGGQLVGSLAVARSGDDATVSLAAELKGASIDTIAGVAAAPLSATADFKLEAQGTGKSFAAVVAALTGAGVITARDVTIRRLDVGAIDRIEPLVEGGLALDAPKVAETLGRELGAADLPLGRVTIPITLSGGAIRSGAISAETGSAKLGGSASLDLRQVALDADLTLQPNRPDAPQIGVSFEGPLSGPKRRVDATAFTGWLSVRAVERETERIEAMEKDIAERARVARLRAEEERKRLEEEKRLAEEARRREEEAKRLQEEASRHVEGEGDKKLEEERRKAADAERRKRDGEARALVETLPRATPPTARDLPTPRDLPTALDLSAPGLTVSPRPVSPPTGIFGGPQSR